MSRWLEAALLGLYIPIVVFSALACWMLVMRVVIPALRRRDGLDRYAIGISCALALGAHLTETVYYGAARWFDLRELMFGGHVWATLWKMLILASSVMAVSALSAAATDGPHLRRLASIAGALWWIGAMVALWVAVD